MGRITPLRATALLTVALAISGCGNDDEELDALSTPDELAAVPEESADAVDEHRAAVVADPGPEAVEGQPHEGADVATLPPELSITPAASAAQLGRPGGAIVAGAMQIVVPNNALPETTLVEASLLAAPEDLDRELPGSLILSAARGAPWDPRVSRAIEVILPLNRQLEPGMALELLAYHPSMRAFLVAGHGRVDADGTSATFTTRQLGDMIVRAAPVQAPDALERCADAGLRLHEAWPGPSEDSVVGLTPTEDRIDRTTAFNLLTDFRRSPLRQLIDFKNEEVVDATRTRRDERDTQDEDYLFDPNAASATAVLAELVAAEWLDPITGQSAIRLRVTEAYDSLIEHSAQSTHYQGRAVDLTLSPVPAPGPDSRRRWYGRLSSLSVCAGFDYVLFENEYHVHASVVPTQFALVVEDEAEQLSVAIGGLGVPRAHEATPHRWEEPELELAEFRWVDRDRFAMEVSRGDSESSRFDLTRRSTEPIPVRNIELPGEEAEARVTVDGLREIVVRDGRAYIVNADGAPPLGSVDADGVPVHIEYPYPISRADQNVHGASFREHHRTRESYRIHGAPR